jgi:hypothetical protein
LAEVRKRCVFPQIYVFADILRLLGMLGLDEPTGDNFKEAEELIVQHNLATASLLKKRLSVGYARAA